MLLPNSVITEQGLYSGPGATGEAKQPNVLGAPSNSFCEKGHCIPDIYMLLLPLLVRYADVCVVCVNIVGCVNIFVNGGGDACQDASVCMYMYDLDVSL